MITKTADFNLFSDRVEWNKKRIYYRNIKYYKIDWGNGNGAALKLNLKNGKKIRMMSSYSFCNSPHDFLNVCLSLDSLLHEYDTTQKIKKKSLSETKFYVPLIRFLSLLVISLSIYRHFRFGFILHEIVLLFILVIVVFIALGGHKNK